MVLEWWIDEMTMGAWGVHLFTYNYCSKVHVQAPQSLKSVLGMSVRVISDFFAITLTKYQFSAQSLTLVKTNTMIAILIVAFFTGKLEHCYFLLRLNSLNCWSVISGINLTYQSGVFGTCIGRMQVFGDSAKSYMGLCGIFLSVGAIIGAWIHRLVFDDALRSSLNVHDLDKIEQNSW